MLKIFKIILINQSNQVSKIDHRATISKIIFFKSIVFKEDFSNQSELMEALTFEQPFSNFKRKVYQIHLADEWIAFRNQKIVELLMG